jgi:hypothetical protein
MGVCMMCVCKTRKLEYGVGDGVNDTYHTIGRRARRSSRNDASVCENPVNLLFIMNR